MPEDSTIVRSGENRGRSIPVTKYYSVNDLRKLSPAELLDLAMLAEQGLSSLARWKDELDELARVVKAVRSTP